MIRQLGVTEIVELENSHNIADWQRRYKKGFRALRVHVGFYDQHLDDAIKLGLKTDDLVPDTNGLITIGPYKIVTDGSLGSQTAYCHEPYPGTEDYGIFPYQPKTFAEMARRGRENGFKLAIHAIGDEANSLTFKTLAEGPNPLPGSTIEHAQLLDFADLPLFKKLGLIASVQPQHMVDDRETCAKFWPGREHRAWAFRSIIDAGIPMKLGSDCPVAQMQPWDALAVCITRAAAGESPMCAEQIIDLETAWAALTSVISFIRSNFWDIAD
jgi:predicted amidohydrolase YtcJ